MTINIKQQNTYFERDQTERLCPGRLTGSHCDYCDFITKYQTLCLSCSPCQADEGVYLGLGVGRELRMTLTKSPDISEGERGINMYSRETCQTQCTQHVSI